MRSQSVNRCKIPGAAPPPSWAWARSEGSTSGPGETAPVILRAGPGDCDSTECSHVSDPTGRVRWRGTLDRGAGRDGRRGVLGQRGEIAVMA